MAQDTFVDDGFEEQAANIVEEIEEAINHGHHEGEVEYDTYQENESAIDVEITITGAWADLTGVAVIVQESEYFTASVFASTDDGRGRVIVGLRFHPDVRGLFEYRHA